MAVSRMFEETELIDGLEVEIVDLVVALLFGSDFRKTKIIKDVEWETIPQNPACDLPQIELVSGELGL